MIHLLISWILFRTAVLTSIWTFFIPLTRQMYENIRATENPTTGAYVSKKSRPNVWWVSPATMRALNRWTVQSDFRFTLRMMCVGSGWDPGWSSSSHVSFSSKERNSSTISVFQTSCSAHVADTPGFEALGNRSSSKVTCRLSTMWYVSFSCTNTRYVLCGRDSKWITSYALSSNLNRFGNSSASAEQPKIRMFCRFGFKPVNCWYGLVFVVKFWTRFRMYITRFRMYMTCLSANGHGISERLVCTNTDFAASTIVQMILSAMVLCSRV